MIINIQVGKMVWEKLGEDGIEIYSFSEFANKCEMVTMFFNFYLTNFLTKLKSTIFVSKNAFSSLCIALAAKTKELRILPSSTLHTFVII